MLIFLPLNSIAIYFSQKFERKQYAQADSRMKTINELLIGVRAIKLLAWEKAFERHVGQVRSKELGFWKKASFLDQGTWAVYEMIPLAISILSFGWFVLSDPENNVLTPEKAFVSLNIINIMYGTLTYFPYLVYTVITASVSFGRIGRLMRSEELADYIKRTPDPEYAVKIRPDAEFMWGCQSKKSNREQKPNGGMDHLIDFKENEPLLNDGDDDDDDNTVPTPILSNGQANDNNNANKFTPNAPLFSLTNVGLSVRKGELIAVVGSVGSGKSSLLNAILGEMQCKNENSQFSRSDAVIQLAADLRVAYVPQQAWLQNATLKQNVTFGERWNPLRFDYIVKACQLLPDVETLPAGVDTEIGENGVNLSGGQKQRVSFARACYAPADLYLLDDPLSAVDAHVASALFRQVLSNRSGLLRNKTRLLVTNDVRLLPHVQRIVVLKDGSIQFDGTYGQLLDKQKCGFDLADYGIRFDSAEQLADDHLPDERLLAMERGWADEQSQTELVNETKPEHGQLIREEKIEKGKVKRSHYFFYFKALKLKYVVFVVFCFVAHQLLLLRSNFYLVTWSETSLLPNNQTTTASFHYLFVYAAYGLGHCK